MHRKYRKIIYNNSYIEIFGMLRQHDVFIESSRKINRFIIETMAASECKKEEIDMPDFSEMSRISEPGVNPGSSLPSLPQIM
jgi:hypothetical protein